LWSVRIEPLYNYRREYGTYRELSKVMCMVAQRNDYRIPELSGKVVALTGGSRGIGRSIALTMTRFGARVAVIDVDIEGGEKTAREVRERGGDASFFFGNVAKEKDMETCMSGIVTHYGGLDILVNNAGVTKKVSFEELTLQEWQKTIGINLTGAFICSKIAARFILKRGGGTITMISSGSAITGTGGGPHYTASKGGINSLVRSLSRELAPKGIRVNGIAPRSINIGTFDSLYSEDELPKLKKQIPMGRLGSPEDIANVVVFLSSDLSSFITGEVILVDGGRTYCG
jgi:3-oxoacyl-[acyl-carrier protein] reductase